MSNANAEMQVIFEALSEKNKDILLLVARGIKAVQDAAQSDDRPNEERMGKEHGE